MPWKCGKNLGPRLQNESTKLGHTQILMKFTASRLSPDETITQYFTKSVAFFKKLIGTTENITDETLKSLHFTTRSNSYQTIIQNFQQQIPAPTAQH
jgi:hypothetical protein